MFPLGVKKTLFLYFLMLFFAQNVFAAIPTPASFLKLGDYGDDVLALQRILNLDKDTSVSEFGAGSLGQETRSFGLLTKQAVIRFQEKYKSEILTPANLANGTGFVGSLTLKKIKDVAQNGVKTSPNNVSKVESKENSADLSIKEVKKTFFRTVDEKNKPDLGYSDRWYDNLSKKISSLANSATISQREINLGEVDLYTGIPQVALHKTSAFNFVWGKQVGISGNGFDKKNNKIYFNDQYFIDNLDSDGTSIYFSMPEIPVGHYKIVATTSKGVSNSLPVFVANSNSKIVKIKSIEPKAVSIGETVTISGEGFLEINDISTNLGIIKNVASLDGKTLNFKMDSDLFQEYKKIGKKFDKIFNVSVFISNGNGITESPGFFDLNI